ncbi:MAG: Glutamine--fructose-6-phosphate aminotransferase [isomerizing] [Anaerolineales bacterium]|nr:Glutamine--fructose-6-phosphate aminotransferase [isomerizing] [Anaerolineales bacterium]
MKQSSLFREIHEQPDVLRALIDQEAAHIRRIAGRLREREIRHVVIAARGTSDNAATYAKYLFGAVAGLPISLATPSLYTLYERPPRLEDALVIGISQSGQSTDIVEVVREGRRQGVPTLAVTNDARSPLAEAASHVVDIHAGEEKSVAATKTYTAQLAALALLASFWVDDAECVEAIERLPAQVAQTLALNEAVANRAERYRYMRDCVVVGRGYNYATAFEIALKLKELTYVVAEPYSSADFRHGPIALVEGGFPVICILPAGRAYDHVFKLASDLKERDAELLVISEQDEALDLATTCFHLPAGVPEWLSPILCVVPGQLLAYHLTLAKGYDPDHPRGLRKVTDTR